MSVIQQPDLAAARSRRRWFLICSLRRMAHFVKTSLQMGKLAWEAHPASFIGLILLELLQGLIPLATAWLTKLLFDLLVNSLHGGTTVGLPQELIFLLIAQAGLSILNQMISPANQYLKAELGRQLTLKMQTSVYEKVNSFAGLAYFEDPRFHDTIRMSAQRAQQGPLQALNSFTALGQSTVTILSFLGVLLAFNPLIAGVIGLTVLPELYAQLKFGRQHFGLAFGNTSKERQNVYYGQVLTGIPFAKEVRLFSLGKYFLGAFVRLTQEIQLSQRRQQQRELRWQTALTFLSSTVASGPSSL